MNIPSIIKNGINTCHKVAESIAKTATLLQRSSSTYNPTTGIDTPVIVQTPARCFIFDYETKEYNDVIKADDRYILLDKVDGTLVFSVGDQILIDSIYYEVMDKDTGETENFYNVQLRKTDTPLV